MEEKRNEHMASHTPRQRKSGHGKRSCVGKIIGGVLFAILTLALNLTGTVTVVTDTTLQNIFMTLFFTSVGYTASFKLLKKGGIQVLLFLLVSAVLLVCLRGMVRKHFTPKLTKTNVDAVIGSRGYVTETVDNLAASGQVKLGAMPWTARSTDGSPIEAGTLVQVDRIEGVKAYVSPVPETANV